MARRVICRITNRGDGKQYIGITSKTAEQRFAQHCASATRGVPGKLYCAMRKHGVENFFVEAIAHAPDRTSGLLKEIAMIAEHDSLHKGYNASPGGDGFGYALMDSETRERVRIAHRKRLKQWSDARSEGEMAALRERVSQQWKNFTPEQRASMKKKMASRKARRYVVTSPDGEIFDVTDLKAFCKLRGLHQGQMCAVANGKHKHCKNWTVKHFEKK